MFFHCAFDGNAPGRRNIPQQLKNNEQLNFKNRFFENRKFRQDRCPDVFFGGVRPRNLPKYFKAT